MTDPPDTHPDPETPGMPNGEPRTAPPPVPQGSDTLGPAPAGSDPADREDGGHYVPV